MKKNISVFLMALALVWSGPQVFAQTLGALQKSAFENRAFVKGYKADLDISKERIRERLGEFYPSLDLGYTLNRLNHDTHAGESRENDAFTGEASWNLFAGGRDYYALKAARNLSESSQFTLNAVRQDISLDVALGYLDVYRALENLRVAKDEIRLYEDRLRQIQLKVEVGVLKKTDLLKVKVEMDNTVQKKRRAESSVATGVNILAFETGTDIDGETLDFSLFDRLPEPTDYQACESLLLERQSELSALKKSRAASENTLAASKASLYPSADLSLAYSSHTRDDYFPGSFENSDDEVRCQLMISMNLFDGMKKYARTNQAGLERSKISFNIAELEENLKTRLKNTLINLDVAFDNLMVAKAGTAEARENLRVADLAFGQGIGTSSDVLDAIFNLSRAKFNLINAHTQVFENDFRLKRLIEAF